MRTSHAVTKRSPLSTLRAVLVMGLVVVLATFANTTTSEAQPTTTVDLGTADNFAILANQSITFAANPDQTTVTGDIGISPNDGTSVTDDHLITHDGAKHYGDAVALQAMADLATAYTIASTRPSTALANVDLAHADNQNLAPGAYSGGALTVAGGGTLTLDGGPDDVWIFQAASSLDFTTSSSVVLTGGAQACNVFWTVGSSATLGTTSTVVGTIMAVASITLDTGANIDGRVLARDASVTTDANTITRSTCATSSTSSAASSGQSLRLVKFFFDADGNRVGAPAGDWTVTASVGGGSVIELDESTISGWANVSSSYTVSESSLEGWPEAGCDGFTLPDIGTVYLDVSGTGDFTLTEDDRAHPVCNQADATTDASVAGPPTVEVPTRVDTGAGGSAVQSAQQVVWLLVAAIAVGALIARRYRFTNDL